MPPAKRVQKVSLKIVKEGSFLYSPRRLNSPDAAAQLFREFLGNPDREVLAVVCVDIKNSPLSVEEISRGSLSSAIVHPREILKTAILSNAAAIILGHNHPSGCEQPSQEDIAVTMRLQECCHLMGIPLLDHLILGDERFISLKERGHITKRECL